VRSPASVGSARISVVVPVHNVAPYLEACLESLAQQTVADLEIVMVDDGSTDDSPAIAERFVARDERFRLLRQENAGQGPARNAGLDRATGEFVAFVDGDDVVPRRAYEVLLGALERTGSDLACGGVRRLTSLGTTRAEFLGGAFERERLQTHITRFPALVVDRLACNKVIRRSFWDRHGLRFPEGVRNEDIWVMLPAHYLARSVDVVGETVYLWRRRESGDLSGSQRRVGVKALRDRVAAVDHVSRFLADRGLDEPKLAYDRSVVGNDLRYFLDILESGDDEFRALFFELANDFLDRADSRVLEQPLAIERLKWHLVRRRALPELLEVLGFQAEQLAETPPVRHRNAWYGDYPYRADRRLEIPAAVYRLDAELAPVVRLSDVRWEGETLRIEGYGYIEGIGAPRRQSQRVAVVARNAAGRTVELRAQPVHRPDVTAAATQELVSLDWSGFVATLDTRRLRARRRFRHLWRRGGWGKGAWTIGFVLRAGGVVREIRCPESAPLHPLWPVEHVIRGVSIRAGPSLGGELQVRAQRARSLVRSYTLEPELLSLAGDVGRVAGDELVVRVMRRDGGATLEYPADVDRTGERATFAARVPVGDLVQARDVADRAGYSESRDEGIVWDVHLVGEENRRRLATHEDAPESTVVAGSGEVAVQRGRFGHFRVAVRSVRPIVTDVEWSAAGVLGLQGDFPAPPGEYELVVHSRRVGDFLAVPVRHDARAGRFTAELEPGAVATPAGTVPLPAGDWELLVRRSGDPRSKAVNVLLGHELLDRLPLSATIGRKPFHLGVAGYDLPLLRVQRDLGSDEQGGFHQRLLRTDFYRGRRSGEVRDVVLYECFGGREYSDSPRAVHEELVRRAAALEHLWVVRDGACTVPDTAVAVPEGSKDYYRAYASARYVVSNDHWPRWAARRVEQTWLQTWHGPPLKRLGRDLARSPKAVREYRRTLLQPAENWHYLVSPAPFATPILRRAFSEGAQVLETGLPRTDVLLRPDRDRVAEDVRRRLALPAGKRTILYAPTFRDHLGAAGGYRHGPLLDLSALTTTLGDEYSVLFRRHRLMVGSSSPAAGGVLDVTAFPDATELLTAVDVLVTDYSSAIFDFAATGRPMVFFTPDLDVYRDEIRGFSIDFEADAPGPLLREAADVVAALRDTDTVTSQFTARYERFVTTYCSLNDGGASSRVVDRVFAW
jgi:CDP-glycerol glycerophosphotransferase